jgi:hypothetical protein
MKNKFINEVNKIKKLMLIDEACTEDEAIKLLKDKDYTIYSKKEKEDLSIGCDTKPLIKCIKEHIDNNESSLRYNIKSTSNDCYILLTSGTKVTSPGTTKKLYEYYIFFWEDGSVVLLITMTEDKLKKYSDDVDIHTGGLKYSGKKIVRYMLQGEYECDNNDINIYDFFYKGFVTEDNYYKIASDKDPKDKKYLSQIDEINKTDSFSKIGDIINKIK